MLRRLAVAALAAVALAAAAPSGSAAPVKLYLNELTDDCSAGSQNAITNSPDDGGACVIIPRLLVDGEGLANTNESYASVKSLKSFKVDVSKPLTGTFALFGSSGLRAAQGPANMAADFTIKIAKKTVGTVRVEGVATPAGPVTKSFSLNLPATLRNVSTNSVQVSVNWITCVGLCGVAVSGASFMDVPKR